MTKYIFWAYSVPGLEQDIELLAHNYEEAKHKILKYISLNKVNVHPVRGTKPSVWE
jgi:hypothetical protein